MKSLKHTLRNVIFVMWIYFASSISTACASHKLRNIENEFLLAKINVNPFAYRVQSNTRKNSLPFVSIQLWASEGNAEIPAVEGVKHEGIAEIETTSNDVASLELWSVQVLARIGMVVHTVIPMIAPGIDCPTRLLIQWKRRVAKPNRDAATVRNGLDCGTLRLPDREL
jgi:hypothetical protein